VKEKVFGRKEFTTMQKLTFIVPFEVPQGQEEEMHRQWHEAAEPLSHAPGFLSARLYEIDVEVEDYLRQHIPGLFWLRDRFRFVNIAEWASLSHYEAAIHTLREGKAITFPSYPAYYRLAGVSGKIAEATRPEAPRTEQAFTFIIPFEVPEGQEAEMRRQFKEVVEGMGRVEGSFGPGLYELDTEAEAHLRSFLSAQAREVPASKPTFRFVNVAEWASVSHYEAVMLSRRRVKPISFPGHGAYYRVVAEYTGPLVEKSEARSR
jgi:heme-degrading monooxygenase HmoA